MWDGLEEEWKVNRAFFFMMKRGRGAGGAKVRLLPAVRGSAVPASQAGLTRLDPGRRK